MNFFKLCADDKLINALHGLFKANIVRIPEARFRPLAIIASIPGQPRFWGYLNDLVEGDLQELKSGIEESRMADISGRQSRSVNLDLGLQILDGFLKGFSLPSAEVTAKFKGARTISFRFQDVLRYYISPGNLGNLLKGHALDAENSSNTIFLKKEAGLLVIDSIITSKDFSVSIETADQHDFSLDVPAIEKMIGEANAGVQVISNTGLDITFKGKTPLTFAFTCLIADLDDAGRISLKPSSTTTHFGANQSGNATLLYEEPGMIEWDD